MQCHNYSTSSGSRCSLDEGHSEDHHFKHAQEPWQIEIAALKVERLGMLGVLYAANYYVNTGKGKSALYDAVRAATYRDGIDYAAALQARVDGQCTKIGLLEADVSDLRAQLATATARAEAAEAGLALLRDTCNAAVDRFVAAEARETEAVAKERERITSAIACFVHDRLDWDRSNDQALYAIVDDIMSGQWEPSANHHADEAGEK